MNQLDNSVHDINTHAQYLSIHFIVGRIPQPEIQCSIFGKTPSYHGCVKGEEERI